MNPVKFRAGHLVATPNALAKIPNPEIMSALGRHITGDWGEIDTEDREANDRALKTGMRLMSVYHSTAGIPFWIITEADRRTTTILLPEEY